MTSLYKNKPYIFAFLLFCVASSSNLIIYNEELLVAGTFCAFVLYIERAFGNSIKNSIDESRNSILQELQASRVHKKNIGLNLKTLQEKVPLIHNSLVGIQDFLYSYVSQICLIASKSVNRAGSQEIELQIKEVKLFFKPSTRFYQQKISDAFLADLYFNTQKTGFVMGKFSEQKNSDKQDKAIKTAKKSINLLKKAKL